MNLVTTASMLWSVTKGQTEIHKQVEDLAEQGLVDAGVLFFEYVLGPILGL